MSQSESPSPSPDPPRGRHTARGPSRNRHKDDASWSRSRSRSPSYARRHHYSAGSGRHHSRSPRFGQLPSPIRSSNSAGHYRHHSERSRGRYDARRRSPSRSRSPPPHFRGHQADRHRTIRYHSRSRSRSRSPSRHRSLSRDRARGGSYRDRRLFDRAMRDADRRQSGRPSQFVLLAPLDPSTTEFEIRNQLSDLRFAAGIASISVLRDKKSGVSRQVALARFESLEDAREFVWECGMGVHIGPSRVVPVFPPPNSADWDCSECQYANLKHSFACSKCGYPCEMDLSSVLGGAGEPAWSDDGAADVSSSPTPFLLLRQLDLSATAESIYSTLKDLALALGKPEWIPNQGRLIRSKSTQASLGFAFVEYASTEIAQAVMDVLTDKSLYPAGFFILAKAASISFGAVSAFVSAYSTSQYTVVVPSNSSDAADDGSLRIVAYRHASAYAVGYPVPLMAPVPLPGRTEEEDADPLAAFYAEIGGNNASPTGPPSTKSDPDAEPARDPIPPYDLIHIPAHEDFIDRRRRLCCLCRRVFPTTKSAVRHALQSPAHLDKLANDLLAQQVAMVLKYKYRHPPPPAKKPKTLETGIGGQLLAKLGWSGGGLGRSGEGITKAIEAVGYTPGAGLGAGLAVPAEMMAAVSGSSGSADKGMEITRKRYMG